MSLKLLFVNSSLTDGGAEKAMSLVAQALVSRGHDVTMVLAREKEQTYPLDPRIALIQFRYGAKGKAGKSLHRLRQIRKTIKTGNYDYVVCYMWDLNLTTLIAAFGLQKRIIVSERAFPGISSRSKVSRYLERIFYRFAYRIVYQTYDAREFCPPELRSRSVIVPNMIEPHTHEMAHGARAKRIVSVGRLNAQKNFPLLLEAFAQFVQTEPDWSLEIYGQGPMENELKSLAEELKLTETVKFAGYVSDVTSRIRDAGMFVLTSDFEGISNAMSEAMALGLPVICTDCPVGGAALLIKDGVSGMLVPVRDRDALTHAMRRVAADTSLAARLSIGAQESVSRFAPDELALVWEKSVLHSGEIAPV